MLNSPITPKVDVPVAQETSKPWHSKTLWCSVIVAFAPFFPPAQAVIVANPEIASVVVGSIFGLLRFLSGTTVPVVGSSGKKLGL